MLLWCPVVPEICPQTLWSHPRGHRDHHKLQISQKKRKFLCKSPKTSKTAVSSRYKIAVRSQILRFNTENASMLSYCTGSMSGTTLVTSTEAQRSLQNSKFCQKYENPSIKAQKRLRRRFWPLQNSRYKLNFKFQRWKCSYVVLLYRQYARKNFSHT